VGDQPVIRIRDLTKDYGATRAVDRMTFDVPGGQILGLLGPNGAGKTTTMRILTGYVAPTRGSVLVDDLDVREHPVEVKQRIGYLPEMAPLYGDMLVYDYLRFVASVHDMKPRQADDRIARLAGLCGLTDVMHRPIRELSRGYRQRAGLAHAMIGDPQILVLDEPTAGLDPNQIVEIRSIIREIGRKKTVVFSTHILSEAEATCDRVVIINRGRIVADGMAEELRRTHGAASLVRLTLANASLADVRDILGRIDGVERVEASSSDAGGALRVQITCGGDVRDRIYRHIKTQEWVLLEMTTERRSLEEVFQQLTLSPTDKEH
jgi:ABC-2 type transport system ATP-binding protein